MESTASAEPEARRDERRAGDRLTTLFQVARVIAPGEGEQLCIIRNIGPGGLMVETYTHLPVGCRVRIESKLCEPIEGNVVWARERRAGIAFDTRIDVQHYLQCRPSLPTGQKLRAPRLLAARNARVRLERAWHLVRVVDVSQGGAKIETSAPVELGALVELELGGQEAVCAHVRWVRDRRVGLTFARLLPLEHIARWVSASADLPPAETHAA